MKLYVVSVRTKLIAVFSIVAFIMIAVVSSADLTGKNLNEANIHLKRDELKEQGVAAEQWASSVNTDTAALNPVSVKKPKMSTEKEVLHAVVAAAVIGVEYTINGLNNDDKASGSGVNENNGF